MKLTNHTATARAAGAAADTSCAMRRAVRAALTPTRLATCLCVAGSLAGHAQAVADEKTPLLARAAFPAVLALSDLEAANGGDGSEGFVIDATGVVSKAGDVNGDSIHDILISRGYGGDNNAYVIFGTSTPFAAHMPTASLNGDNGLVVTNVGFIYDSGGAGDINGDGLDDIVLGNKVVFGTDSGAASIDSAALTGANGFTVAGIFPYSSAGAGDFNGDGFDDAAFAQFGSGVIVFGGGNAFPDSLSLTADNSVGLSPADLAPFVSGVGDVNGDGIDDVGIAGDIAHVVFGTDQPLPANLDLSLLDGTGGITRTNSNISFSLMRIAGAGDINGDGADDVIMGGSFSGPAYYGGEAYVLFGSEGPIAAAGDMALMDGTDGFRLPGNTYDYLGGSVNGAGDINGDGVEDIIIGTSTQFRADNTSWVVFGSNEPFPAEFDVDTLDGDSGFAVDGFNRSVSGIGDVNADGIDDFAVASSDSTYVVFGRIELVDTDDDGVPDATDNCTQKANADQLDADGDGIGNACDADIAMPNDCMVNFLDLGALKAAWVTTPVDKAWNPHADFDGNGEINFLDLAVMREQFYGSPGPSAQPDKCVD